MLIRGRAGGRDKSHCPDGIRGGAASIDQIADARPTAAKAALTQNRAGIGVSAAWKSCVALSSWRLTTACQARS